MTESCWAVPFFMRFGISEFFILNYTSLKLFNTLLDEFQGRNPKFLYIK